MDNRLREIEQWVAEARDGLSDGGREAYVRKLYLLDAEIRAVIKDSGILPQADSPRPATSLVRRIESYALPVASALVVLAAATVYLRGGVPAMIADRNARANQESSILTARPDSAQKNTPPAGPSSTPHDWHEYLAANGEQIVHLTEADEPVGAPARQPQGRVELASAKHETAGTQPAASTKPIQTGGAAVLPAAGEKPAPPAIKPPAYSGLIMAASKPVPANDSTNVSSGVVLMNAGYSAPVQRPVEEKATEETEPKAPVKTKKILASSDKKVKPIALDLDALIAKGESSFTR
jgi:hypothetical protein